MEIILLYSIIAILTIICIVREICRCSDHFKIKYYEKLIDKNKDMFTEIGYDMILNVKNDFWLFFKRWRK